MLPTTLRTLAVTMLMLAGCSEAGPERAEVAGSVLLNGQPVTEGAINFFPAAGTAGPESGAAIRDGKFHIPRKLGPVVGENRVELRSFQKTGRRIQDPTAPPGILTEEIANIFPAEYNTSSKLSREIKRGKNDFEFKIDKNR